MLRELIAEWLRQKPASVWGEFFDLHNEERLEAAAKWLASQISDLDRFIYQDNRPSQRQEIPGQLSIEEVLHG